MNAGAILDLEAETVHSHDRCTALGAVLERIGNKWVVMIVGALREGPKRFNALRREIGVSQRMLSLTLRALERDGLVCRTCHPTIPPSVEYALTGLGLSLVPPLQSLSAWADLNLPLIEAAREKHDASCGAGE